MKEDAQKFTAMRSNLPHFLALKSFEIIYKKELLREDWQRYGWRIVQVVKPDKTETKQLAGLQDFCEKVQIGLIEQQGRSLKKTQTRESEGDIEEINNPFQAARAAKLQLEKLLGKDYLAAQDNKFFTAWAADKSAANPGVRCVVRPQLLQLAVSDPECWQQIERMKALKFLAGKPEAGSETFWHLPELPAPARDIELASIISRCPGVAEVVSGKTEQWTNKDPQVLAAGLYLIAHAKQIAANTKRTGLVRGAKFSEQMAPAALFNKALELMGYAPEKDRREGSGQRLNVYRLEVTDDAIDGLGRRKRDGESQLRIFKAELKAVRARARTSIDAAARRQIIARALTWISERVEGEIGKAIFAIKQRHAGLKKEALSKLGDALLLDADLVTHKASDSTLTKKFSTLPVPLDMLLLPNGATQTTP